MLTRCPECTTQFRVHPEQMRAAGGRVRCGCCGCLFDVHPIPHATPTAMPALAAPADTAPTHPTAPSRSGRIYWGLGALLLGAGLLAQAAWWDRHELAEHPETKAWVQQACAHLPCNLTAARSTQHIEVLDRALDAHPTHADALRFTLRMLNRWDRPQAYPLLELSLFDRNGELAGTRRFDPSAYLPNIEPGSLMQQNETVDVTLDLQDQGILIAGFHIDFL